MPSPETLETENMGQIVLLARESASISTFLMSFTKKGIKLHADPLRIL